MPGMYDGYNNPMAMNDPEVQRQRALNDELQRQIALMTQKSASQPKRPEYTSLLDKDGNLPANLKLTPDFASKSYDAMSDRAIGGKSSPWLKMMLGQSRLGRSDALQTGASQVLSGQSQALGTLARSGGYTSGARERLARDAARNMMMVGQSANRDMTRNNLNATSQEATTNNDYLKYLSGVDLDRTKTKATADQFNIKNMTDETMAKRAADLKVYEEQMKTWAAERTAEATENSGK